MVKDSRKRRRNCWRLAKTRARRRKPANAGKMLFWLLVILELLSTVGRRRNDEPFGASVDWESRGPNPYERGETWGLRRRAASGSRYKARPSMMKLMKDLRRPAARSDALRFLLERIPDPATREWIREQVAAGDINRISVYIRPGRSEDFALAGWYSEAHFRPEDDNVEPTPSDPAPSPC